MTIFLKLFKIALLQNDGEQPQQTFVLMKTSFVFKTNIFPSLIRLQKTSSRWLDQDQYNRLGHTSSRRLQDIFKTSCQGVFKTSSRSLHDVLQKLLQDIFKMFLRPLQDVFQKCLQDIFKTSSRQVCKTSWRRLQHNNFSSSNTSWRILDDVLKMSREMSSRRLQDVFKMSWKTKNYYAEVVLKTSSRHVLKASSRRLQDQQMFAGAASEGHLSYHIFINELGLLGVSNFIALGLCFLFGTKFSWNEGIGTCFNIRCV